MPRQASSSNGGPRLRVAFMPVDYKGRGHSNPVFQVSSRLGCGFSYKAKNFVLKYMILALFLYDLKIEA